MTGTARIDPLFAANAPARAVGASVTFEPGARTAPIEEIHPGDVIWFLPGEKHWHGGTPITAMTHIAIQEQHDGKAVDWMEKVSDEQYQA